MGSLQKPPSNSQTVSPVGIRSGEVFIVLNGVTRTADTVRRQAGRAVRHIKS